MTKLEQLWRYLTTFGVLPSQDSVELLNLVEMQHEVLRGVYEKDLHDDRLLTDVANAVAAFTNWNKP